MTGTVGAMRSRKLLSHCNNIIINLQAFQLIILARYLLGVPNPSPVSHHALSMHILRCMSTYAFHVRCFLYGVNHMMHECYCIPFRLDGWAMHK